MTSEKKVIYSSSNTYSVLNNYTKKTKNVWIVFHGLGYLSKYFIKYFSKVNTLEETKNIMKYVDEVYKSEINSTPQNLIVLGYSQGVSIATRWVASRKINCDHLILHSGGIPVELNPEDFSHLKKTTKVWYTYGNRDPYINDARKTEETLKGNYLFGNHLKIEVFDGIHEINTNFIMKISKENS